MKIQKDPYSMIYEADAELIYNEFIDGIYSKEKEESAFKRLERKTSVNMTPVGFFNDMIEKTYAKSENSCQAKEYISAKMDIVKIGNNDLSINEAMKIARGIYEDLDDKSQFYGVLLMDKTESTINPLHPVIASDIVEKFSEEEKSEERYTLIVYLLTKDINEEDFIYKGQKKMLFKLDEGLYEDVASIVAATQKGGEVETRYSNFELIVNRDQYFIQFDKTYVAVNHDGEEKEVKGATEYLIPAQIANIYGVAYPYYGMVLAINGKAWNLLPMMSANISHPRMHMMKSGGNICTHSGEPYTEKGVASLNHSNFTSELNTTSFGEGALAVPKISVEISFGLYFDDFGTDDYKDERPLSMSEFLEQNPAASQMDYIEYISEYTKMIEEEVTKAAAIESITKKEEKDESDHNEGDGEEESVEDQ